MLISGDGGGPPGPHGPAEAILGFQRRGDVLRIEPRVPAEWPEFTIDHRFGAARYTIVVHQPGRLGDGAGTEVTLDGRVLDGQDIPLVDDGAVHEVVVRGCSPR